MYVAAYAMAIGDAAYGFNVPRTDRGTIFILLIVIPNVQIEFYKSEIRRVSSPSFEKRAI